MDFWTFMTVAVCVTSFFGYLRSRHAAAATKDQIDVLQARVASLEADRVGPGAETIKRLEVVEDIVFSEEMGLERQISEAARRKQPRRS